MLSFVVGDKYPKPDIREAVGYSRNSRGGPFDTGIAEHDGEFFIFANVGTAGRTGHDYTNQWDGPLLRWSHKERSKIHWPSVQELLAAERVHVFWRTESLQTFTYAGLARVHEYFETSPVTITWAFTDSLSQEDFCQNSREEYPDRKYEEGTPRRSSMTTYRRDRTARQVCLEHYKPKCVICGFSFEARYGDIGKDYIHIHHLVPLSTRGWLHTVDPIKDLRPVCANCHAMIHRRRDPFSIEEVRLMLRD